ncbi:MAG: hypothetical protein GY940_10950, partial [bacterium]|nr:hypothetical protein [bacterium]
MPLKTIVFSGYISGDPARRKRQYLERLDRTLRAKGYRLLLVNLGTGKPVTRCDFLNSPNIGNEAFRVPGKGFFQLEHLPGELMDAAAVEAETAGIGMVAATLKVLYFASFMEDLFRETTPALCIMWHEFNGRNYILRYICRQLGLPYLYIEYGVLPGTINIDEDGQMAESSVSQRHVEFRDMKVPAKSLKIAREYLKYALETKQSRKPQNLESSIEFIVKRARDKGRIIVFYAGQNDWGSGIMPPWLENAKVHSPFYKDTIDALTHLRDLARRYNWHILFK